MIDGTIFAMIFIASVIIAFIIVNVVEFRAMMVD